MFRRVAVGAVVLSALALLGCGDSDGKTNSESGGQSEASKAPGFKQLHQAIFSKQCSSSACHGGSRGIANLSFEDPKKAYDMLIDRDPTNGSALQDGFKRVVPEKPGESFLLEKLKAPREKLSDEGYGGPMPLTGKRLGPKSLEAVRSWIEAGAPMDGAEVKEVDFADPKSQEDAYVDCKATDEKGMQDCFEPKSKGDVVRLHTPPIKVPPKTERIVCTYLDYRAPKDLLIEATEGQQMGGGHHIAVFVANSPSNDFKPHECGDNEMTNYRFVAGAGGGGGQDTNMPTGSALKIDEGRQLVIQSHYINTKDKAQTVMDAVDLKLADKKTVKEVVDPFAMIISNFKVPAKKDNHERTHTCTADRDLEIYMLLGHTHDYGTLFEFELLRKGKKPQLLYHATDGPLLRDSPEIEMYDPPMQIKKGDKFRMTCRWNNTTDHELTWPEEMCVALMYYGPGKGWLTCSQGDKKPKELGGGGDKGCASPYDKGNKKGVGEYCTPSGSECLDNSDARMCLAAINPASNFCSKLGCKKDSECGDGAKCVKRSAGSACVPKKCLSK